MPPPGIGSPVGRTGAGGLTRAASECAGTASPGERKAVARSTAPARRRSSLQRLAEPLPFAFMQHSLAAIRAGRPRTRFVAPAARQRQRRLGLARAVYEPAVARSANERRRPVDALRTAARSHAIVAVRGAGRAERLSGRAQLAWSRQVVTGLRRARPRSAAPWRA
jgi:hypothetical protein